MTYPTSFSTPPLKLWQTPPHSLCESFDHRQRTLSPSESSAGIVTVFGQPCWCRTIGDIAEIGDELILPISGRLVRLAVVERNQLPPPFVSEIQQQLEQLDAKIRKNKRKQTNNKTDILVFHHITSNITGYFNFHGGRGYNNLIYQFFQNYLVIWL